MAGYPRHAARWIVAALAMTFGLQLLRVFMATTNFYLVDASGAHPALGGIVALGVFAVGSLTPVVAAGGGRPGRVLRVGGVALAVIRVVEQILREPLADLVVSAMGVAAFLAVLSSLASGPARSAGAGLLSGIVVDVFVHGAAWTLDLSWRVGIVPLGMVVVLAVVLAGSALRSPAVNGRPGWSAMALGPWLVLQMVVFSNIAFAGSITRFSLPGAWLLVGAGSAGALAVASKVRLGGWSSAGATILLVGSVLVVDSVPEPSMAVVALAGGQMGAGLLLVAALQPGKGGSAPLPLGLLAMVMLLFGYYGSYQFDTGFRSSLILLVAAVTVAVGGLTAKGATAEPLGDRLPVTTAAALLVPALIVVISWAPPTFSTPQGVADVRIMSYNVHQGFNTSGRLDVEALAQVIEAERPDIVALQEVARGWVVDGSVDLLAWLSKRLQMPFASGPTADGQWGNAVLSRYPIAASRNIPLPTGDLPLRRGYLDLRVDLGDETLRVLATHLHHVGADEEIRELQAELLLMGWSGTPRTVLLGDLNATPDSTPMHALAEAGFVDGALADGIRRFTSPAADPTKTIDYILLSPDLIASDISVPATEASDHLPVAVTITLP